MQCIVVDALNSSSSSCLRVGICLWVKLTDTLRSLVLLQFPTAVTTSNNVCLKSYRLNVPHDDKSSCPPETSQRDCNRIGKYYHTPSCSEWPGESPLLEDKTRTGEE